MSLIDRFFRQPHDVLLTTRLFSGNVDEYGHVVDLPLTNTLYCRAHGSSQLWEGADPSISVQVIAYVPYSGESAELCASYQNAPLCEYRVQWQGLIDLRVLHAETFLTIRGEIDHYKFWLG